MSQSVSALRQQMLDDVKACPGDYAAEEVALIEGNEWWLQRYLVFHKDTDKAKASLKKAAKWRKDNNMFNLKETDFPQEMHRIDMITVQGVDQQGTPIMWFWGKKFFKNEALKPILERYTAFRLHQLDVQKGANNPGLFVIDSSGSGLSNIDMNYSFFLVELLQDHYPQCFRRMVNVDLPFILNATSKIIMAMMGEQLRNLVDFVKHQKLVDYMSGDNIPRHLEGSMSVAAARVPEGCRTLKEQGMDDNLIAKVYSTFKL